MNRPRWTWQWAGVLALLLPVAAPAGQAAATDTALAEQVATLAPQRPGHPDLYVLAVAGDGSEQVFLNEVLHLQNLAARRLDAAGRVLVLANHATAPAPRQLPAASMANLRAALAALGKQMDPDEDLLLLYISTHGTEDHGLLLRREDRRDRLLRPRQLRAALDASGIRHRVLVISACYSGGFARALRHPDTLLLTAARSDRPSFGCGNDSVATFFGRAWLVDGLNDTVDFIRAFDQAKLAIARREDAEDLAPSEPQLRQGYRIGPRLADWRASFVPGPALPYPHQEIVDEVDEAAGFEPEVIPPLLPAGSGRGR